MAEPYLLDTGVLLLVARGGKLGQEVAARYNLTTPGSRPLVSIVSHGELLALVKRNNWGEKRRAYSVDLLANGVVTIEISQAVVEAYVEVDGLCAHAPHGAVKMGKNDMWIAASAMAARATLLTTDKDFDHLHPDHLRRDYIDPKGAGTRGAADPDR